MRTRGTTRTLQSSKQETQNSAHSEDSPLEVGQAVQGEEESFRFREDWKRGVQREKNHLNDHSTVTG
ncbi:unnamed protein product [Coregonus sp. 'balchen']|nr:unnamed protein product [Coregonus sp. 'balchen']